MSKSFSPIIIKIDPYLKCYLRYLSVNGEEPFVFKKRSFVHLWLNSVLMCVPRNPANTEHENLMLHYQPKKVIKDKNDYATIAVPCFNNINLLYRNYITDSQKKEFVKNLYLKMLYEYQCFFYQRKKEGYLTTEIVNLWFDRLEITDEFLQKSWWRQSYRIIDDIKRSKSTNKKSSPL